MRRMHFFAGLLLAAGALAQDPLQQPPPQPTPPLQAPGQAAPAVTDNKYPAVKLTAPPKIDGIIEDAEWAGVPKAEGLHDSETGTPKPTNGTFWLAYDDKYIYFACRIDEPNPAGIKAQEYRQNVGFPNDDVAAVIIDPFGATDNYNVFQINPRGATNVRIAGGRAVKREWLGDIQGKARITETGWEAEARIPWGVMRLPSPGSRNVSFNFFAYDPRRQRDFTWKFWNQQLTNMPSWLAVTVPSSGNARSLKLLPYAYAGWDGNGHVLNGGLDMKTSITDQIDAVGAINPDFRNIENQILSLDFSYFERLAGESRPFFLEGQEFFNTSRDAPLFASQRIGIFDAGLKTFGKLNDKMEVALLSTIDFDNEHNTVGTFRYRPDTTSTVTLGAANRERPNNSNLGTFLSYNKNWGNLGYFGQVMTTNDSDVRSGRRYNTGFSFNKQEFNSSVEYVEISREFLPRLGFAPERNFRGVNAFAAYLKPVQKGPFLEYGGNAFAYNYSNIIGGGVYRRGASLDGSLTLRNGIDFDMGTQFEQFFDFHDYSHYISVEHPRGDPYRHWQLDYSWGRFADQRFQQVGASVAYRPIKQLQLTASVQAIQHFTRDTQTIIGVNYDLGKDLYLTGRAVRVNQDTNAYLALRKSGNFGAEYFLILGDPNSNKFQKSLILKVVYPFELKF